jgi:hypothetical protein
VTGILSEVLTNNAAAALMYPIAANVGDDMGIQVRGPSVLYEGTVIGPNLGGPKLASIKQTCSAFEIFTFGRRVPHARLEAGHHACRPGAWIDWCTANLAHFQSGAPPN